MGGYYDYWQTGSRATLRELLLNEGLAVHASRAVAPGFDPADYFGYTRRQYHRLRELEAFLRRAVDADLDLAGLGLRLRYLSGGMSLGRPAGERPRHSRAGGLLPRIPDGGSDGRRPRAAPGAPRGRRRVPGGRRRVAGIQTA